MFLRFGVSGCRAEGLGFLFLGLGFGVESFLGDLGLGSLGVSLQESIPDPTWDLSSPVTILQ